MLVLEAGSERVDRFQAQREAGLKDMEELRMQELRIDDAALRLEDKLRREREVLAAQRKAEAKAAQELAEIEATRRVADARTKMIADLEASLKASDEMIFSLLGPGTEHAVQVTHERRRVAGTVRITDVGVSYASGTLSLSLGNGDFHQAPFTVSAGGDPGEVVARYPPFNGFLSSSGECLVGGVFSKEHRIMSFEGDPENRLRQRGCQSDRLVIDLGTETASE